MYIIILLDIKLGRLYQPWSFVHLIMQMQLKYMYDDSKLLKVSKSWMLILKFSCEPKNGRKYFCISL